MENNFKGTKGNWYVDKSGYITANGGLCIMVGNDCISVVGDGNPHQPIQSNALLISKAPEMLQMLEMHIYALDNGMLDFYKKYGFNISELSGKVRELIKEATEI